jgi:hypothetical protein
MRLSEKSRIWLSSQRSTTRGCFGELTVCDIKNVIDFAPEIKFEAVLPDESQFS